MPEPVRVINVNNDVELSDAMLKAQAGDHIILKNGVDYTYTDIHTSTC